jgi:hypothetical protein
VKVYKNSNPDGTAWDYCNDTKFTIEDESQFVDEFVRGILTLTLKGLCSIQSSELLGSRNKKIES